MGWPVQWCDLACRSLQIWKLEAFHLLSEPCLRLEVDQPVQQIFEGRVVVLVSLDTAWVMSLRPLPAEWLTRRANAAQVRGCVLTAIDRRTTVVLVVAPFACNLISHRMEEVGDLPFKVGSNDVVRQVLEVAAIDGVDEHAHQLSGAGL